MLVVDISDLLVDISQLHEIFVHLVVVDHLVDFLHPLVVHEHAVVTLRDHLLPSHELVVLWLHPEPHRLNRRLLIQKRLTSPHRVQHIFQLRRVVAHHFLHPTQEAPLREVLFERVCEYLRRGELVEEETVQQGHSQSVDVAFVRVIIVVLGEIFPFANVDEFGGQVVRHSAEVVAHLRVVFDKHRVLQPSKQEPPLAAAVDKIVGPDVPVCDLLLVQFEDVFDEDVAECCVLGLRPGTLAHFAVVDDLGERGRSRLSEDDEALVLVVLLESRLHDEGVRVDVAVPVVLLREGPLHHRHLVECALELLLLVPVERNVLDYQVAGTPLHAAY